MKAQGVRVRRKVKNHCATLQTDTERFEKLQLGFRLLIASAQPIF